MGFLGELIQSVRMLGDQILTQFWNGLTWFTRSHVSIYFLKWRSLIDIFNFNNFNKLSFYLWTNLTRNILRRHSRNVFFISWNKGRSIENILNLNHFQRFSLVFNQIIWRPILEPHVAIIYVFRSLMMSFRSLWLKNHCFRNSEIFSTPMLLLLLFLLNVLDYQALFLSFFVYFILPLHDWVFLKHHHFNVSTALWFFFLLFWRIHLVELFFLLTINWLCFFITFHLKLICFSLCLRMQPKI